MTYFIISSLCYFAKEYVFIFCISISIFLISFYILRSLQNYFKEVPPVINFISAKVIPLNIIIFISCYVPVNWTCSNQFSPSISFIAERIKWLSNLAPLYEYNYISCVILIWSIIFYSLLFFSLMKKFYTSKL